MGGDESPHTIKRVERTVIGQGPCCKQLEVSPHPGGLPRKEAIVPFWNLPCLDSLRLDVSSFLILSGPSEFRNRRRLLFLLGATLALILQDNVARRVQQKGRVLET